MVAMVSAPGFAPVEHGRFSKGKQKARDSTERRRSASARLLDRVIIACVIDTPRDLMIEQLTRLAREVMPAFRR
jgi:hypothetical protein